MDLGFAAPAWRRLAVALAVAAAGWTAVEAVERRTWAGPPPLPVAARRPASLVLTSSRAVSSWAVSVDGRAATVRHQDERRYEADIALPGESRGAVLVTATPVDDDGEPWAVRIELRGVGPTIDRTAWAVGDLVDAVPLVR
jgi:hypothetical protein